jgi:adenylate cyclase
VRCAVAIQKAFEKYRLEQPGEPISLHIGLHTGEPVRDGGDLLGRSVITASRLSGAARPGEVLVSSLLHELAESTGEFRFGQPRQVELKGISGPQTAYPVDWQS